MSADNLFTLWGVNAGGTLVGGIKSYSVKPGMKVDTPLASGQARGRVQFIPEGKPVVDFTTYAVGSALTALTTLGKLIASMSGGLVLYGQCRDDGTASAKAGSNHLSFTYASGLLMPTRVTAQAGKNRGYAEMTVNGIITFDGSNAPLIPASGVALPAGLTEAEYYGLGPATAAVAIPQLTSLDVAFGIGAESKGSSEGKQFDTAVWINEVKPVITLKGTSPTTFTDAVIPLNGRITTQVNTKFYLRRYDPTTGRFYEDNVAQHIKIVAAGLAVISSVDAGQGEAEITVELPVVWDGTHECLVTTVGSTIS